MPYFFSKQNKRQFRCWLSLVLLCCLGGCTKIPGENTEPLAYRVLLRESEYEIRAYDAFSAAQTQQFGDYRDAKHLAYRRLAGYIFGRNSLPPTNNRARPSLLATKLQDHLATNDYRGKQEVQLENASPDIEPGKNKGLLLPMQFPYFYEHDKEQGTMLFVLPAEIPLERLPQPMEASIALRTVPAKTYAVAAYSWLDSSKRNKEIASKLYTWLKQKTQYTPVAAPLFAGYNMPYALPFWRKNEILLEVQKQE